MAEVDGFYYDFACIRTKFDGVEYPIEDFSAPIKRENAKGFGNSATVKRVTRGRITGEGGKFTMDLTTALAFKTALATKYGGVMDAIFDASVSCGINDQAVITNDVPSIVIEGISTEHKEGVEGPLQAFDFSFRPKTSDGVVLLKGA